MCWAWGRGHENRRKELQPMSWSSPRVVEHELQVNDWDTRREAYMKVMDPESEDPVKFQAITICKHKDVFNLVLDYAERPEYPYLLEALARHDLDVCYSIRANYHPPLYVIKQDDYFMLWNLASRGAYVGVSALKLMFGLRLYDRHRNYYDGRLRTICDDILDQAIAGNNLANEPRLPACFTMCCL
jgi:hypothetical protein